MHGVIGKLRAVTGRGAELAEMLAGVPTMPGCLSYIVAVDPADADAVWVTEVWESRAAHMASLELEDVQHLIDAGSALIAAFEQRIETTPLGGIGLK